MGKRRLDRGYLRLKRVVEKLCAELPTVATEEELRSKVVLPLLEQGIGIRRFDLQMERTLLLNNIRPDVVVRLANRNVLVVECKKPGSRYSPTGVVRDALEQAEKYAIQLQVNKVLVTDGNFWHLTCGRRTVAEAETVRDFLKRLRQFYAFLRIEELWQDATGPILPSSETTAIDIDRRCLTLDVTAADIKRLNDFRDRLPDQAEVLDRRLRLALTVRSYLKARSWAQVARPLLKVHIDWTFVTYSGNAWLYDPFYVSYRREDVKLLKSLTKAEPVPSLAVRLLVVRSLEENEWRPGLAHVAMTLLDEGWTVGVITVDELEELDVQAWDAIGDHVVIYEHPEAFHYSWHRDRRRAVELTDAVHDWMSEQPDRVFPPDEPGSRERLLTFCARPG